MIKPIAISILLLSLLAAASGRVEAQPNNADLFARAGESVKAGKYDDAISDLTAIITADQRNYKAYLLRGICYWAKKELEVAELKKDPARAYRLEAEIYGNLKPGEVQPKSQGSLSAIADLTKAIQITPGSYSPYNIRAKVYVLEKDLEPAISDYQKVMELKPDYQQEPSLKGLKETFIKIRNDHASSLRMRSVNLAVSIGYSKEYQTKASGEDLAKSQTQTAENEKLYKSLLLKAAQTYYPIDFYTFDARGDCYRDLQNWNAAIADYTEALKLKPAETSTHAELAKAYSKAGQPQKALAEYDRIISMPVAKDKRSYQNSAYLERANIFTEQGKLDEAIAELDKVVAADPGYYFAYFNRGKLHAKKGNKPLARADFVKASETPGLRSASQKEIDILDSKARPAATSTPRTPSKINASSKPPSGNARSGSNGVARNNSPTGVANSSPTPVRSQQSLEFGLRSRPDYTARYFGAVINGIADGYGEAPISYKGSGNGGTYKGDWKDNDFHGKGTFTWPGGSRYVGDFVNGKQSGNGGYYWADGEVYEGGWKDGYQDGNGTYLYSDGRKYTGGWSKGSRSGYGKLSYPDGKVLEGLWKKGGFYGKDGLENPTGRIRSKRKYGTYAIYEGETLNELPDGQGKYTDSTSVFEGEYKRNVRDGKGKEVWTDGFLKGCVYEGEYKEGRRTGYAKMTCPDGTNLVGYFLNGTHKGSSPPSAAAATRVNTPSVQSQPQNSNTATTNAQLAQERTKLAALHVASGLIEKDPKLAIVHFRKALEADPNYQPAKDAVARINADEFIAKGDKFSAAKDHVSALAEYTKAVEAAPKHADAYWKRARTLIPLARKDPSRPDLKLLKDALSDLSKVIELQPSFADGYSVRAAVHIYMGTAEPALADISKAISLNPKKVEFYSFRAQLYGVMGDQAKQLVDERKVQELKGMK